MTLSYTEENYLKTIRMMQLWDAQAPIGTNQLAKHLGVKPSSVNEMLKRLREKQLISYQKYGKISLLDLGKQMATQVIRKHRLWETFLVEKLGFNWEEVHQIAEELEHIQSQKLIDRLDAFLDFPAYDPHGDPIPDAQGQIPKQEKKLLSQAPIGQLCTMVSVKDHSPDFLQYVADLGLKINTKIQIIERKSFDGQTLITYNQQKQTVSQKFAENIFVSFY